MEALSADLGGIGFRDKLDKIYNISCFLESFVGALDSKDTNWVLNENCINGWFTIYMLLNAAIDNLRDEAEELKIL